MTTHRDHVTCELAYTVGKKVADQMIAAVRDEYADDLIGLIQEWINGRPQHDYARKAAANRMADLIRKTKTEGT